MATLHATATDASPQEVVSLEAARRQLGVWDAQDDVRVETILAAARDHCERWGECTLRLNVTRTALYRTWPGCVDLRWPPITGITSVKYYADGETTLATLDAGNYRATLTEGGGLRFEWASDAVLPSVHDRQDAVQVAYVCGYAGVDDVPPVAKQAVLLTMTAIEGEDDTRSMAYAEQAAKRLLSGVSSPSYT